MELEIFTLCDFAQEANGKLTIVGTFDSVAAAQFPVTQPQCSIAVKVRYSEKEAGPHNFVLQVKHEGKVIPPSINGNMNVQIGPAGYGVAMLVMNFNNLPLKAEGRYTFELLIDGKWAGGLTLTATKLKLAA